MRKTRQFASLLFSAALRQMCKRVMSDIFTINWYKKASQSKRYELSVFCYVFIIKRHFGIKTSFDLSRYNSVEIVWGASFPKQYFSKEGFTRFLRQNSKNICYPAYMAKKRMLSDFPNKTHLNLRGFISDCIKNACIFALNPCWHIRVILIIYNGLFENTLIDN